MRAALYARVSTTDKGQNPEVQLSELREFCTRRKWDETIFADAGYSGAKVQRPQLDLMMAECRRRKFDVVVVYRFDRFARSLKHLVDALAEFDALGIQFVSVNEQLDTTTPQGKLLFHVIAAMAEFERALIRERVRSGLDLARANGKRLGRPPVVADASEIRVLHAQGWSTRAIAKRLKLSRRTVGRLVAHKPLPKHRP